jgi:uncharacterized DUF497 family protein
MNISFDSAKSGKNLLARGVSFELAAKFEWDSALVMEDQALGLINNRLYMMVFTPRANKVHVISLRKANKREVKRYEAQA